MAKEARQERERIAHRRLISILRQHGIANARTLEQKISDAGPNPQRVDPHILTQVRNELVEEGRIRKQVAQNTPWFYLPETDPQTVKSRLAEQLAVWKKLNHSHLGNRIGQALEIAVYRALAAAGCNFFGRFRDLAEHDDSTLYRKEEPPQHIGSRSIPGQKNLDFLVQHPSVGWLGLECKNVREWLYPDRNELKETLEKCLALDCLPVVVARRIPYVTFRLLNSCGVILHQTYNQLLPESAQDLANKARHKEGLGYHDIRIGNTPNERLIKFLGTNMMTVASGARERFDEYKDLLEAFVIGEFSYPSFAARVRRRENGLSEDFDDRDSSDDEY